MPSSGRCSSAAEEPPAGGIGQVDLAVDDNTRVASGECSKRAIALVRRLHGRRRDGAQRRDVLRTSSRLGVPSGSSMRRTDSWHQPCLPSAPPVASLRGRTRDFTGQAARPQGLAGGCRPPPVTASTGVHDQVGAWRPSMAARAGLACSQVSVSGDPSDANWRVGERAA
jgi:hypothetical protein